MPVHHGAHYDRAAGRGGGVNDGMVAPEHPVVGVAALDAHPGLVGADHPCLTQPRYGVIAATCKMRLRTAEHVHQTALADRQTEQIGKRPLKPFAGQRLEGLQIGRDRMDPRRTAFPSPRPAARRSRASRTMGSEPPAACGAPRPA